MIQKEMMSDRATARITGILFIIATAASILSLPFLQSINASTYLVDVSANGNLVTAGAMLLFIAAAASASIAISMYPILRRNNLGLALGAVGFRLIEAVFYIVGVVGLLSLLSLSQEFVNAGVPASPYYQALGDLTLAAYHWAGNVASLLAFSLGAAMYYIIFYRTRLVPRWLSGWGLIAISLTMVSGVLVMFNLVAPMSTGQVVLNLPIAVQEMALAVWLIAKGFNTTA